MAIHIVSKNYVFASLLAHRNSGCLIAKRSFGLSGPTTIVANLLSDRTLAGAVTFALCNAGEALLAAGLIERQFGSGFALDRLRQVLGLLAAAVFASAISGLVGTLGFKLFHSSTAPS